MQTNKIEMSATDSRETYEMLRAAHTLLRMAFGATALISPVENEESAKEFTSHYDYCFKSIADAASKFLALASEKAAE